ncbi:uncharacterized protein LOC132561115 [Ylistrum balloti]|uniref:uncharacterized protein LOC132561115 n=1 Tax=Ylistrum balloti TaxID=509963 RepID=UPI002905C5B9|nr:uncharacterized protein LOC132561115 [Ylistrum balloti]
MAGELVDLRLELQSLLSKLLRDDISDSQLSNLIDLSRHGISKVLERLLNYLEKAHDVEKCLTELPDIGQLLGRLCGNHAVRGNKLLYQSTMKCVLSVYRIEPSSPLEQKAKDWALAQLQSTLKKKPNHTFPICSLGISHTKVTEHYIEKLSTRVLPALKERIGEVRVKCLENGTHIPGEVYTDGAALQQIVDLLLSVPQSDEYLDIWTDVLWILSVFGPEVPWVQDIYQKITSNLHHSNMNDENGNIKLSKTGYRLLWQSYLPSLESTVLDILDQTCKVRLPSSVKHVLRKKFLLEICSEEPLLLKIVCQMLQELMRHAGANSEIVWVIAVFYQLLQEQCFLAGNYNFPMLALYPKHLNVISAILSGFQTDEDVDMCADTVCRIVACLEDQQQLLGGRVTLHNGMLYHRHLYLMTIRICLCCHKKFVEGCSSLLSWILDPVQREIQRETKLILNRCIQALRSLMTKVSLEDTDLLYVIETEQNTSDAIKTVIGHLVMMFLYKASAGMHVFKKVLSKVSLAETPLDKLVYMMIAQEELDVRLTDWSPCRQKKYCNIVQEYLHQASCDNLNTVSGEISMATTKFLQKYCTKL